jgi:uncharacterized protein (TIGR02266 family)
MDGPPPSAVARSAREGRGILTEALSVLQKAPRPELAVALERIADASGALYSLESEAPASNEYAAIRAAVRHLGEALATMQALPPGGALDGALEAVARTLALLYPLARSHQRRRRHVMLDLDKSAESFPAAAPAPEPVGRRDEPPAFAGRNKRAAGDRVQLEVDIGLLSESHFYTGLSRDLSQGGVFVATYQPKPPGTAVTLYFVLPSGRAVRASGVVCWASEARGELPPGMGVAFETLSEEDLRAVVEFCETRSPLYHHAADD